MNNHCTLNLQGLQISGFPPREGLVVGFTALGLSSKEIAKELSCTPRNIENLREAAKNRTHSHNTPHLISQAFKNGHLRFLSLVLCSWLGSGLQPVLVQQLQISSIDDDTRKTSRQSRSARSRSRANLRLQDGLTWDPDLGLFSELAERGQA